MWLDVPNEGVHGVVGTFVGMPGAVNNVFAEHPVAQGVLGQLRVPELEVCGTNLAGLGKSMHYPSSGTRKASESEVKCSSP